MLNLKLKKEVVVKDVIFNEKNFIYIAGPCSVESQSQIDEIAHFLSSLNVRVLRGGAFKPRTSPYDFQGLGEKGLQYLKRAAEKYNMIVQSEIVDKEDYDMFVPYVDIFQIGMRNMCNYPLLKKMSKTDKPIFLKRSFSATYNDLLMSVEYILEGGNTNVILCERGIRTFENYTRNTLDLTAVPALKNLCPFPVVVDPSHGTGKREFVSDMAKGALAVGASGIMLEVHSDPEKSFSDARQTIDFKTFSNLKNSLDKIASALEINVI
jgi:3-deoxy-7-phosphoheptulonate synthase